MRLVGANPSPRVKGLQELPGKSNYFLGMDPGKWRTNISTFAKVSYEEIYPGISLVYYGNPAKPGELEYDFVVAPGIDPKAIKLAIQGARKVTVDARDDLVPQLDGQEIRLHKPLVYEQDKKKSNPRRHNIDGSYRPDACPVHTPRPHVRGGTTLPWTKADSTFGKDIL